MDSNYFLATAVAAGGATLLAAYWVRCTMKYGGKKKDEMMEKKRAWWKH